jgi:hypothetical protein
VTNTHKNKLQKENTGSPNKRQGLALARRLTEVRSLGMILGNYFKNSIKKAEQKRFCNNNSPLRKDACKLAKRKTKTILSIQMQQ